MQESCPWPNPTRRAVRDLLRIITASIILQLLSVTVPYLEKLTKEGELGRRKITQDTGYGALLIAVVESSSIAFSIEAVVSPAGARLVSEPG